MNEKELLKNHITHINRYASEIKREVTLMEICGGHTNVIIRYGIRDILPENIRLISGPGCPVCVTTQHDIDCIVECARHGIPIATYGDMLRVPGNKMSLDEIRGKTGMVFEVYSASEVVELQKKYPDIVFFGIGFETTAPMTAFLLDKKICVYSAHKLIPPALKMLASGDLKVDGFINPGHVSTIIGIQPYTKIRIPQVIAGFSAEQILRSIRILLELIRDKKPIVVNGYPEVVRQQGNKNARLLLKKYFTVVDSEWRGLGVIAKSGLEVKNATLNAKHKYYDTIKNVLPSKKTPCRCGDILRGLIEPTECPLYKKQCTPKNPQGACMVSAEGSCAIYYRYGK
ncbi:MAG: hydrogenase formation protein HypD [Candidatus Thermoplasmatota archaeon]